MTIIQLIKVAAHTLAKQHDEKFVATWRSKMVAAEQALARKAFAEFRKKLASLPENYVDQKYRTSRDPSFNVCLCRIDVRLDIDKEPWPELALVRKLERLKPITYTQHIFEYDLRMLYKLKVITRKHLLKIIEPDVIKSINRER